MKAGDRVKEPSTVHQKQEELLRKELAKVEEAEQTVNVMTAVLEETYKELHSLKSKAEKQSKADKDVLIQQKELGKRLRSELEDTKQQFTCELSATTERYQQLLEAKDHRFREREHQYVQELKAKDDEHEQQLVDLEARCQKEQEGHLRNELSAVEDAQQTIDRMTLKLEETYKELQSLKVKTETQSKADKDALIQQTELGKRLRRELEDTKRQFTCELSEKSKSYQRLLEAKDCHLQENEGQYNHQLKAKEDRFGTQLAAQEELLKKQLLEQEARHKKEQEENGRKQLAEVEAAQQTMNLLTQRWEESDQELRNCKMMAQKQAKADGDALIQQAELVKHLQSELEEAKTQFASEVSETKRCYQQLLDAKEDRLQEKERQYNEDLRVKDDHFDSQLAAHEERFQQQLLDLKAHHKKEREAAEEGFLQQLTEQEAKFHEELMAQEDRHQEELDATESRVRRESALTGNIKRCVIAGVFTVVGLLAAKYLMK